MNITSITGEAAAITLAGRPVATLGGWTLTFDQGIGAKDKAWEMGGPASNVNAYRLSSGGPFHVVAHVGKRQWRWRDVRLVRQDGATVVLSGKGYPEES